MQMFPTARKIVGQPGFGRGSETYGKNDIDHPSGEDIVAPIVPGVTGLVFRIDFPTTELLV